MELKELKDKSEAELRKLLAANRERLRDLRFSVSMGQLKQNHELKETRKLIARILTVAKLKAGKPAAKQAQTAVKEAGK